jgi:hypothetical protein
MICAYYYCVMRRLGRTKKETAPTEVGAVSIPRR